MNDTQDFTLLVCRQDGCGRSYRLDPRTLEALGPGYEVRCGIPGHGALAKPLPMRTDEFRQRMVVLASRPAATSTVRKLRSVLSGF